MTEFGVDNYLASYVAGTAISDRRLVKDDGQKVTIKLKDYRTKRRTTETMIGEELLKRFASHILPLHCKRIRYLGLFAPQRRRDRLDDCRRLIAQWRGVPEKEELEVDEEEQGPLDQEQIRKELFIGEGNERRTFPATCRFCKGCMTPVDRIDGEKTMRLLPYLIVVMR
ncbi:MAG: transposase [Candidatus Paceibacterota bacterium]